MSTKNLTPQGVVTLPIDGEPTRVVPLPIHLASFAAGYDAVDLLTARGVHATMHSAGVGAQLRPAIFAPEAFAESFETAARRFKRVPRRGVRLAALVDRAAA